jgi:hypothetical protein
MKEDKDINEMIESILDRAEKFNVILSGGEQVEIEMPSLKIGEYRYERPEFWCELGFIDGRGWIYGLVEDSGPYNCNHKFMVAWYTTDGFAIDVEEGKDYSMFNLKRIDNGTD